jgi:SAM-dependent methyltransferase
MKLHQLVRLRNQLSLSLDLTIIEEELDKNCQRLETLTQEIDPELEQKITAVAQQHNNIKSLLERDKSQLDELITTIQDKINSLSTNFFAENYQLELKNIDADTIRKTRSIASNEQFELQLLQRINLHSNWQYPALEIGCGDGKWTKYLVASDPLYIADIFEEFLQSAIQQFEPIYQGRVRKYIVKDFYKIANLPKNQFSFIFSYNFFNYLSLDSVKQLLIQSFDWLRPGGKIIFTYNNADLPAAAAYAENYFMTYVPKSILQPMAESLGYTTTFSFDFDPAFSIIEFQKPGTLKSIKLGQTVGEIKTKNLN